MKREKQVTDATKARQQEILRKETSESMINRGIAQSTGHRARLEKSFKSLKRKSGPSFTAKTDAFRHIRRINENLT